MYCKECGEQLLDNASFCKNCGKAQPTMSTLSAISQKDGNDMKEEFAPDEKVDIEEQTKLLKKHKIFYSNNEVLIDTLGSGLISTIVVQGDFGKSVMFCSNKRVYQKGKIIVRDRLGKFVYHNGDKSVDLREITGLSFQIESQISRFKFIIFLIIIGIVGFAFSKDVGRAYYDQITFFSWVSFLSGIILTLIYYMKKPKYFIIEFAGGEMITNCNWYARKSIKRFMKNIALQKDEIFN